MSIVVLGNIKTIWPKEIKFQMRSTKTATYGSLLNYSEVVIKKIIMKIIL